MASDRTPDSSTLDAATVEALRVAFVQSMAHGSHAPGLHHLLRTAAQEARAKGIQAEQLLVVLKDIWYSLPELAAKRASDVENTLLQELISRCIREYYAL